MCIQREGDYKLPDPGMGYRVEERRLNGTLVGPLRGGLWDRPLRRWLKSADYSKGGKYDPGFYIFRRRTDAIVWRKRLDLGNLEIHRVKYRGVNLRGYQKLAGKERKVFTVKEIFILKTDR